LTLAELRDEEEKFEVIDISKNSEFVKERSPVHNQEFQVCTLDRIQSKIDKKKSNLSLNQNWKQVKVHLVRILMKRLPFARYDKLAWNFAIVMILDNSYFYDIHY